MFVTKLGPFNGKTWEDLCQLVFKIKHSVEGYQHIQADPGDFGLEGYTIHSGIGFQCYCPEKHYGTKELYEAQRDKITTDIKKLKTNQTEIAKRIGMTKIGEWFFVTPVVDRNALLAHVRQKEIEARAWKLPILKDDFTIHLRDADFYLKEINEVRSLNGVALNFDSFSPALAELTGPQHEYEGNVLRKSELRLAPKGTSPNLAELVNRLYSLTLKSFLEGDGLLRRIEQDAPTVYFRLVRLVNEYENHVQEKSTTWDDTAEALTNHIRDGLSARIHSELAPEVDGTTADQIARHIVARWLAICQLDFVE